MKPEWLRKHFPFLSMIWLYDFLVWLGKAALDKVTDKPSMTQIVSLMAATSMCIGALALLLSKSYWVMYNGGDISWELAAVVPALCVLAGFNYKASIDERTKTENPPTKPTGATE
jgi:hypothetical protein